MEIDPPSSTGKDHFKLWNQLELHEFQHKFVIRSLEFPDQGFSIARSDGSFHKLDGDVNLETASRVYTVFGVAGTIRLLSGTYILVITSHKDVGTYLGFPIFRVMSMKFLSCNRDLRNLTNQQKKDEAYFQTLLKIVEETPGLYYSYETDITLNLQRRCKMADGWMSKPIWKQADPRFVWNRNILEELIENKLDEFIVPLLQGSFQMGRLKLNNLTSTITLISRRCARRLGTRMWRRGANLEGDTANFIETEQLLEYEGFRSSFLQVRGSIPLLWEQIVDLSYKPRLAVIEHEDTSMVVKRHFHDLLQRYGDTIAVDLTDKHGNEGHLNLAFATEMEKLPDVRYVSFDFHQRCGNANFDSLKLLYDEIAEDFEKQGYFLQNTEGELLAEQKGIIRSNCIDCLDRTNVTQSYLARISLNQQLQRMCALAPSESITTFTDHEDFEIFRNLWVDQGDEISLEYSGTNALKGDIVRYGKQTVSGLIKDGISALSRYYLNNFQDGVRQDAIDLISGNYTVSGNSPSPFQLNKFESRTLFPVASAILIGGLTVTSITLNRAGQNAQSVISSIVCVGATAGMMALMKANGRQICSRPRLCGLL
ncbi:phosphoinositide phosphatase SAC8 isoform X1 [Cynara cardunculus var. scolymus]|uniref:phosphoinositide phosphatase SAC8 isoform X1 n=1 Tax=Cynara cardunculus var. scolymus TaxID=59895 RepID=UPI000D628D2A|nr:phosphoinositide phosphatase SAC8 isoform X1 [Cynara cardunculus var. scolymus]